MDPKRLVASGYDRMHQRYDEWSTAADDPVRRRFVDLARGLAPPGATLLDLGCGTGIRTAHLASGYATVGVDLSAASLAVARERVPTASFIRADMATVAFRADSFDLVTAFYSLIHVPRTEHACVLASVASWLRPGGHFVVTMGGGDAGGEGIDDDWLGAPMYWSGWDHRTNRRLVEEARLTILQSELVTQQEDATPVTFLWVVAMRPR